MCLEEEMSQRCLNCLLVEIFHVKIQVGSSVSVLLEVYVCVCVISRFAVSDCLLPHGLQPAKRFLSPWNFPGKNIGAGCHFLLQGVFPTQDQTLLSGICCIVRWTLSLKKNCESDFISLTLNRIL